MNDQKSIEQKDKELKETLKEGVEKGEEVLDRLIEKASKETPLKDKE